jgi:hypothetical protein
VRRKHLLTTVVIASYAFAVSAIAQSFDLPWWTVDGGGAMWTIGGTFEVSGTIGQPDANAVVMTGGVFQITGGFWASAGPTWARGDLDCDGFVNAFDIDPFVRCLVNGTPTPPCTDCTMGDIDQDGFVNAFDIDPFVRCIILQGCP